MSSIDYHIGYLPLSEEEIQKNKRKILVKRIIVGLIILSLILAFLYLYFSKKVPEVNVRKADTIELMPKETQSFIKTNNENEVLAENIINKVSLKSDASLLKETNTEVKSIESSATSLAKTEIISPLKTTSPQTIAIKLDTKQAKTTNESLNIAAISNETKEVVTQPEFVKTSIKSEQQNNAGIRKEVPTTPVVNKSQYNEIDDIIKQIATIKPVTEYEINNSIASLPKDIIASVSSTIQSADIQQNYGTPVVEVKKNAISSSSSNNLEETQNTYQQNFDKLVNEADLESIYNITF